MKPLTFDGTVIAAAYDQTLNKRILNIKFNSGRFDLWSYCENGELSTDSTIITFHLTYEEAMRRAEIIIDCYRKLHPDHDVWGESERRAR